MHKRTNGAYKTLGEFRLLAIDILTNFTEVPDRAILFTNPAGTLNMNWKTLEEEADIIREKEENLKISRVKEVKELKIRLSELEALGIKL